MELALFVYLAGVVGKVGATLAITSVFGVIAVIIYLIVISHQLNVWDRSFSDFKSSLRNLVLIVFSCAMLASITPSEKTMYMMLAGYTGQQVLQSETASKVHKVIDAKLDEYIKEMTETKEKK